MEDREKIGWNFDNSYSSLPDTFFSHTDPTPVSSPKLVILNRQVGENLGLNIDELKGSNGADIFGGNKIPEGAEPLAQAYAGHQFGHFTMLGDGRAVLLGEQITPKGERFDVQLKGSGRTPYSRGGDGRAALGPMLREYIISEAMHGLGIPTTRSLAVVTTGEAVRREKEEIGAVLTRIASSHIRVGTFEYASQWGSLDELRALADYTLGRHYPDSREDDNKYLSLLKNVIKRQAALIARWQLVGFIHGVMNTDNVTISGETIDYGPCAFMDTYDPKTVFSSIDTRGRYAYGNQPVIGGWNMARFAETLLPLIDKNQDRAVELAQEVVSNFTGLYQESWLNGMRGKLGIFNEESEDEALFKELLDIMEKYSADYTNTFSALTFNSLKGMDIFETEEFKGWNKRWQERLKRQEQSNEDSKNLMKRSNPSVIPRNHRVEEALKAAAKDGDYSVMDRLLEVLKNPYANLPEHEEYKKLPPPSSCPYRTFCGT